jgi:hypothetical protein
MDQGGLPIGRQDNLVGDGMEWTRRHQVGNKEKLTFFPYEVECLRHPANEPKTKKQATANRSQEQGFQVEGFIPP